MRKNLGHKIGLTKISVLKEIINSKSKGDTPLRIDLERRLELIGKIINGSNHKTPYNTSGYRLFNIFKGITTVYYVCDITTLIALFVYDELDDRGQYGYEIIDLQKSFTLIDTSNLHNKEKYRADLNFLLKTLTSGKHSFGEIEINEDWNITGGNSQDISSFKQELLDEKNLNDSIEDIADDKKDNLDAVSTVEKPKNFLYRILLPLAITGWLIAFYFLIERSLIEGFFLNLYGKDFYIGFNLFFYSSSILILFLVIKKRRYQLFFEGFVICFLGISTSFFWLYLNVFNHPTSYFLSFFISIFLTSLSIKIFFKDLKDSSQLSLWSKSSNKIIIFSLLVIVINIVFLFFSGINERIPTSGTMTFKVSDSSPGEYCGYHSDRFKSQRSFYIGLWKFNCEDDEYIEIKELDPITMNILNNKLKIQACGTIYKSFSNNKEILALFFDLKKHLPNNYLDDIITPTNSINFANLYYNNETDNLELYWNGFYDLEKNLFIHNKIGPFCSDNETMKEMINSNNNNLQILKRCE